jgi:hypothetical protein
MKPKRHRELVYLIAQKASVGLTAEAELAELDAIVERAPAAGAPSEAFSFKVEDADGSLVTVQRGQRAGKTLADRGAPSEAAARAREALQDLPEHHECRGCRNRIAIVSAALDTLERELAEKQSELVVSRTKMFAEMQRLNLRITELEPQLAAERESNTANMAELVRADGIIGELRAQLAARPGLEWRVHRMAELARSIENRMINEAPGDYETADLVFHTVRQIIATETAELPAPVVMQGVLEQLAPKPPEGRSDG